MGRSLVFGPDLIVNGDFSDGSTGWTLNTGWAVSGGIATKTAGSSAAIFRSVSLTVGRTYAITYTISGATAGTIGGFLGGGTQVNSTLRSGNGLRTDYLVAVTGNNIAGVTANGTFNGSVDNISVQELIV